MSVNVRDRNAHVVEMLASSIRDGGHSIKSVPGLLKQLLEDDGWRDFTTQRGEHVTYDRFEDFVTTPLLKGLGADIPLIKRLVSDQPNVLDLVDQALQKPSSLHAGNNVPGRPEGNTSQKALRRLRKDRPDLHAQVLAEELSPHAAMIEAGFRPKTITVRLDVDSAARTLTKHFSPDECHELARLLVDTEDGP